MMRKGSTLLTGAKPATQSTTPANCARRRHLAEEFATIVRLYAEAVVDFTVSARVSQDEYRLLLHAAEGAQRRSEEARVAFEDHVALHQCHESYPGREATKLRA